MSVQNPMYLSYLLLSLLIFQCGIIGILEIGRF